MRLHRTRLRTAALVTLLGVSLVAGVASYVPEAAAQSPNVPAPAVQQEKSTPGKDFAPTPAKQAKMPDFVASSPVWPTPTISSVGVTAAVQGKVAEAAEDSPVSVTFKAAGSVAKSAAVPVATLEVLSQDDSSHLGISGVGMRLSRTDTQGRAATAQVSVDYSKFADAYGGDWSSRLRLVELACTAASTCTEKRILPAAHNDVAAKVVTAEVDLAPAPQAKSASRPSRHSP